MRVSHLVGESGSSIELVLVFLHCWDWKVYVLLPDVCVPHIDIQPDLVPISSLFACDDDI